MTRWQSQLAARFCPVFYFDASERYFPASYMAYARNSTLMRYDAAAQSYATDQDLTGLDDEAIMGVLRSRRTADGEGLVLAYEEDQAVREEATKASADYMLSLQPEVPLSGTGYSGAPGADRVLAGEYDRTTATVTCDHVVATVHAWTNGQDGFVDITYNVFFPWNGTLGDHAADNESVVVRLYRAASRTDYEVVRLFGSAHGNGMWYPTDVGGRRLDIGYEGARPVVFVARESHAMYVTAGSMKRILGFGDDVCSKAHRWLPPFALVLDGRSPRRRPELVATRSEREATGSMPLPAWVGMLMYRGQYGIADNRGREQRQTGVYFRYSQPLMATSHFPYGLGGTEKAMATALSRRSQGWTVVAAAIFVICATVAQALFVWANPGSVLLRALVHTGGAAASSVAAGVFSLVLFGGDPIFCVPGVPSAPSAQSASSARSAPSVQSALLDL